MPKLSRWFVKCALVCLLLGSALAALTLANAVLPFGAIGAMVAALQPLSWHLLTMGWATQLIFGVAYWMFPLAAASAPATGAPASRAQRPGDRRGDERLGWAAFGLLNGGLLLRAIGEPTVALWPNLGLGALLPISALAQIAAMALFVAFIWPRIRPLGR
jgi:hypothetical protein